MSFLLAHAQEQSSGKIRPATVSHEGRQVYDVETRPVDKNSIYRNFDTPFSETERNLIDLQGWPEGWNGYDAARPNLSSVKYAYSWIEHLYRDLSSKLWIKPNVIADADGDVVFEWWKGSKKLTVYVSPTTVEYIKVEGPDIDSDMEDGIVETPEDSRMLWRWLIS